MPDMQPGLMLSFDDRAVDQWYSALPIFAKYNAKATFFVSEMDVLGPGDCIRLKHIEAAGHTLGCHGLRHRRAKSCVNACGPSHYMNVEIFPSLYAFHRGGLRMPTCWSYPCGHRDEVTDKALWKVFGKLRASIGKLKTPIEVPEIFYPADEGVFATNRLWVSCIIDGNISTYDLLEQTLQHAAESKYFVNLCGHGIGTHAKPGLPVLHPEMLEFILRKSVEFGLAFYTYDAPQPFPADMAQRRLYP